MTRYLLLISALALAGCAPVGSPAVGPGTGTTHVDDPAVRAAIASHANRARMFHGVPLFPSMAWKVSSASIGGPVLRGGWDAYCVEMEFPNGLMFSRNAGRVNVRKANGQIEVETLKDDGYLYALGVQSWPCGEVQMKPFPEAVESRRRFIEGN